MPLKVTNKPLYKTPSNKIIIFKNLLLLLLKKLKYFYSKRSYTALYNTLFPRH